MATTKIVVSLPDGTVYDVRIGGGLITGLGQYLQGAHPGGRVFVVTDSNVGPLYLPAVKESLSRGGYQVTDITVPAGEASKSVPCATEAWEAMARAQLPRDGLVVALGGGVVGDLAGFAASTYMRGVALAQVPTSLLAMVDSSVGGKTGVNLDAGKNLVGTFKQPLYVCADLDALATLPQGQWASGLAEIAKSAVIGSDEFFFWLNDAAPRLVGRDIACISEAIARSVVFKADVVALDAQESKGIRECLNYGHTLGHAIEVCAGYGHFSHGQAVAEGMRFAARLGVAVLGASPDLVTAQDELLDALGLPALDWWAPPQDILDAMGKDKKARGGSLRFVLPRDVGDWELVEVDAGTLREHVEAWARSKERDAGRGPKQEAVTRAVKE